MSQKTNLLTALLAGFLGGSAAPYILSGLAHAQTQVNEEVRAMRFTVVDRSGKVVAAFSSQLNSKSLRGEHKAAAQIRIFDDEGREIWTAPNLRVELLNAPDRANPK